MLMATIAEGHLHGVTFLELDYQIGHCIYADDIHLIVEDRPTNIEFCIDFFTRSGEALGLVCNWQKTHAVYLSNEEVLAHLLDFGWSWEDDLAKCHKTSPDTHSRQNSSWAHD